MNFEVKAEHGKNKIFPKLITIKLFDILTN